VLRPHAKGGLGEVFVARDEELHREVALKEIQAPYADDPDSRSRFLLEAEVTGGLEHPGLVPVYGLGTYPDGRPFYAMRFIKGDTFHDAIKRFHQADGAKRDPGERGLALRGLLRRFIDVCNAVAYAHARGVLHRDLKPGNTILGNYGETFVVDWGLAKATGRRVADGATTEETLRPPSASGSALTRMGTVQGTPAFMSPEQAAGKVDELGPASDVYSLGATLYCLLTGKAPFEGRDVGEVLRQAQQGKFAPPRQLKREVPPALEAVCLQAMALKPEDRYPTARALAADVEQWLADEPVSAWREPLRLRLGRWARRHQKAVAATVAGLLVSMLAGVAGAWWLSEEKDKTEQALNRSQRAEKSASAQRQLALKTVRRVVDRIHARLKGSPNQQELRKDLLNEALEGLKEVDRAADTAEADHATIRALVELGDIFRDIEVGGLAEARKQYERAKDLARRVAEADPRSTQAQSDLSLALTRVGDVLLRQRETKAALDSYKEGLGISRKLVEADRGSALAQRELAVALIKLGDVQLQQGETKAALDSYQESLGVFRQLTEADRHSTLAKRDLALCLERVGDVQLRQGKTKETLDSYKESLGLRRELAKADRNFPQAQRDLSLALERVGDVQLRQGGPKAALTFYQESLDVRRQLAKADRLSALAQRDLAIALNKLGGVQLEQEDTKGALASYQEALGVSRRLAEADRDSAEAQRDLAIALSQMGDLHLRQRQTKAALQFCQESLGVFRQLAEADRDSAEAQRDLALTLDRVGDVQLEQRDTKGALASYQESLGL
jgi:serine/threonine protein kinase/predicted negative regulator of RcsB-dependent stress response